MTRDVIAVEIPVAATFQAAVAEVLAAISDPSLKAVLDQLYGIAATSGSEVLGAAGCMSLELHWPAAVRKDVRSALRAQLVDEMRSQVCKTVKAQAAALFAFQVQVINTAIPAIVDEIRRRAAAVVKPN